MWITFLVKISCKTVVNLIQNIVLSEVKNSLQGMVSYRILIGNSLPAGCQMICSYHAESSSRISDSFLLASGLRCLGTMISTVTYRSPFTDGFFI